MNEHGLPDTFHISELDRLIPAQKHTDNNTLSTCAKVNACDYLYAAKLLSAESSKRLTLLTTAAVLAAFSCELYLKSILYFREVKVEKEHSLKKLYLLILDKGEDTFLINKLKTIKNFDESLEANSNAFMNVRYLFEYTRTQFDLDFLFTFAQILCDYPLIKE